MFPSRMFIVGLTGGIGTGKSTVAAMLADHGARIIDCDALGRTVVEPGGRAYDGVVQRYGPSIVRPDGAIDRPALASIVFSDPKALADLNAITHPAIDAEIMSQLGSLPNNIQGIDAQRIVVLDMAVLTESNLGAGIYEYVVVVEADLDTRITRLIQRGLTESDARARISSQASDEQRRAIANAIVSNRGDLVHLRKEVANLWQTLTESGTGQETIVQLAEKPGG